MITGIAHGHDGPDPLFHWAAKKTFLKDGKLEAQRGPAIPVLEQTVVATDNGLFFDGTRKTPSIPSPETMPTEQFTVATWFSIHQRQRYGGVIGAQQDNGDFEKGWVLGYDNERFYVTISTEATDDGDGKLVLVRSETAYDVEKLYHVAATYDGDELVLYVNGKRETSSKEPGGKIIYAKETRLGFAGYVDDNEDFPHKGQIISVQIYDDVAKAAWIAQEFSHNEAWTKEAVPVSIQEPLSLLVSPYLQWGTADGMTVMWETTVTCEGEVRFGETSECKQAVPQKTTGKSIHEIRIDELKPGTQYFYRTVSRRGDDMLESEVRTFQTDAGPDTPFAFAVISDTQGNPEVSGKFAELAWAQRPNFLLHPGDLVSTGKNKQHWVEHFFASMEPLTSRVPFYAVLGNHEQNSQNYYNYVSVPEPEYYYTFQQGNAQFFMIDTNKDCSPGSEQYRWLDKALTESKATWKFVTHHHPPYSSDENDYGNLWETNKGRRGDLNARKLTELYDRHGVDIVWNGHIHSYERTWPMRDGKPVEKEGPIYMITGGGGGGLETPGPFRNPFELLVRRGHHYSMVWINGGKLEFKAYDIEGTLFDSLKLNKDL